MAKGFQHKEKKRPDQLLLYIPVGYQETVKKAKEIMKRENDSLSHKFCLFLSDYVRLHSKGNPQTMLFKETPKKPVLKCEKCPEKADYRVFIEGGTNVLLCSVDFQNMREKSRRLIVGYRKL